MTRCIYVLARELNDNCPPNEATKSLEHIIQWALGGQ
jgi:hypothetical protein